MITIRINSKKFKGVYSWEDITLQRFSDLASIAMPDGYESYILADGKFSVENIEQYIEAVAGITDKQLSEDFPAYYRQVIGCLTNIPAPIISKLDNDKICDMYEYYFKPFVISLLYNTPVIHFMGQVVQYEPRKVERVRIGLRVFRLPESINILGQDIALGKEPIISYAEASDIFKGMKVSRNDVNRLALFMAIYCRKRGEEYSERKALERQELFMRVPMSVVWSVFFYTVRRVQGSSQIIQLFSRLPKQIRETVDQARGYKSLGVAV